MQRNATFETFGGTATLISDYSYWSVQARPKQATLGALVILAHGPATAFSELPPNAFAELAEVVEDVETTTVKTFGNDKINYLMLMMVDPHVHFHVLPRYKAPAVFEGESYPDPGWPGQPNLAASERLADVSKVADMLRRAWPRPRD
ncbi:HIT domain-containing protein [Hyphomonas sp.]|uniref:HIT family protein n=1 Tax=Hyphomonas sp. TaxID=87 RepID=UPI0025C598D5|nr:HIT domain-containing protein [Hyphomonas sp.]